MGEILVQDVQSDSLERFLVISISSIIASGRHYKIAANDVGKGGTKQ